QDLCGKPNAGRVHADLRELLPRPQSRVRPVAHRENASRLLQAAEHLASRLPWPGPHRACAVFGRLSRTAAIAHLRAARSSVHQLFRRRHGSGAGVCVKRPPYECSDMRTGSSNSDFLMLVVPIAVSFGLIIVISGGVDNFMNLADIAIPDAATAAVTSMPSL